MKLFKMNFVFPTSLIPFQMGNSNFGCIASQRIVAVLPLTVYMFLLR